VDVDPRTYNLTPESVRGKLTPRTKGVVAVHQFGLCADLKALREAIGAVPLIEDAACAIGSESP
jgi:perosamine synthetase